MRIALKSVGEICVVVLRKQRGSQTNGLEKINK